MKNPYNNLAISSFAIQFVLQHLSELPISKLLLILPIVYNKDLLSYFASSKCKVYGVEYLIVHRCKNFLNFNDRYYDSLTDSINAIQFLIHSGYMNLDPEKALCSVKKSIEYESKHGSRSRKIYNASRNIACFLNLCDVETLYLNLRVQL